MKWYGLLKRTTCIVQATIKCCREFFFFFLNKKVCLSGPHVLYRPLLNVVVNFFFFFEQKERSSCSDLIYVASYFGNTATIRFMFPSQHLDISAMIEAALKNKPWKTNGSLNIGLACSFHVNQTPACMFLRESPKLLIMFVYVSPKFWE